MSKTVLVVDDILINRKLIKECLSKAIEGIDFLEAKDGKEALEVINKNSVSVIILDIMMPIMDGIEALSKIKEDPFSANIPVIMWSALDEEDSVQKALELGAVDYFTKPLTSDAIRITLPLKVKNAINYYNTWLELEKYKEKIKEELQLAEQLQKALVFDYKSYDKVEVWARYVPCEEVGGDIFCTKQVNDKFWFIIADICGHGISSAMMSMMLTVIFNAKVEYCKTPGELLNIINNMFFEVFGEDKLSLISAFAGFIIEDKLWYSNAGHPYPVIYNNSKKHIKLLEEDGFLIGMLKDVVFESKNMEFGKGNHIFLYTDGLFSNMKEANISGWTSVLKYCNEYDLIFDKDKSKFLDYLVKHFNYKERTELDDDIAVMIIKNK
ncbi:MAG: SpoIIE family protein phosphatase [Solirubrobacterales bacterium]